MKRRRRRMLTTPERIRIAAELKALTIVASRARKTLRNTRQAVGDDLLTADEMALDRALKRLDTVRAKP